MTAARLLSLDLATPYDKVNEYAERQYQKGLRYGREANCIYITSNGGWGASMKDGGHISSYELLGYHCNTKDLMQGFLDSQVEIRFNKKKIN